MSARGRTDRPRHLETGNHAGRRLHLAGPETRQLIGNVVGREPIKENAPRNSYFDGQRQGLQMGRLLQDRAHLMPKVHVGTRENPAMNRVVAADHSRGTSGVDDAYLQHAEVLQHGQQGLGLATPMILRFPASPPRWPKGAPARARQLQ